MQQYSSLPEQNAPADTTPTLLTKIQQLHAELWLERSLNHLQTSLNDCLFSAGSSEAKIYQAVVNEINMALNTSSIAFKQLAVGIALFEPQENVGKVHYVSPSPSPGSQPPWLKIIPRKGKKLWLKLQEVIKFQDLQQLQNQEPPSAWQLTDDSGTVMGWLMIATASPICDCEAFTASQNQLKTQLMAKSVKQCATAIVQLRQMQRTNQLKNQFLANTSHEIRTPLSPIIGFTHLLLAQGYDPSRESHKKYLTIIQSSGKHLLALINDILDLSKIEANQLEVQWEKVNVPELCRNVLALVKEKAANKGLKLRLELEPDVTTLVADPLRLRQMLLNLLFNAVKFTSKGAVGLQVVPKGLFMHFTVWDTGTGISQSNQAQLFKPYFQIPNAAADGNEGTGLGLALTRKLAEIHGGSVEVESEVDFGSRFTLILPLTPTGKVAGERETWIDEEIISSPPPLFITPSTSLEILLVEDDSPNAEVMQIYLGKLGYKIIWVNSAAKMWEALTHLVPAVILLDIYLPDSKDLKLVQQLRANSSYGKIPVIAQTAMAMKGDREICLAAGVNEYISKPIDLPLLASLIAKYSQPAIANDGEKE